MLGVLLIANERKADVVEAVEGFRPWLEERARVVGRLDAYDHRPIDGDGVDLALVFGGDGTILGMARRVVDLGVPLVGINFGKLGFLAPFTLAETRRVWDDLAAGRLPVGRRVMLEAIIRDAEGAERFRSLAMNDCVLTAGPPFRMIDMELTINPEAGRSMGTQFSGDGAIVATPTGSTAYNLSAGGPVVAPDVESMVITPICPHTLSFRPIVLSAADTIALRVHRANQGTTVVMDGQVSTPLDPGDELTLRVYPKRLMIVENPRMGYWKTLAKKMHWAARPRSE